MNGTFRFFAWNNHADWAKGQTANLEMTPEGLTVGRTPKYVLKRTISFDPHLEMAAIRDIAMGEQKTLYLLDAAAKLWVYHYDIEDRVLLQDQGHGLFGPQALIAYAAHSLCVADRGVTAYSITNAQAVWQLDEWRGISIHPLAVTAAHGLLYVLIPTQVTQDSGGRLKVPADTDLVCLIIQPSSGAIIGDFSPQPLTTTGVGDLLRMRDDFCLAVSAGNHTSDATDTDDYQINLLCTHTGRFLRYTQSGRLIHYSTLLSPQKASSFAIDASNRLYVSDGRYAPGEKEDDRFIQCIGETIDSHTPLPGFRGAARKLLIDSADRLFVLHRKKELAVLEPELRTQTMEGSGLAEGMFLATSVDSTETEMRWHKLILDADIPKETQIQVSVYYADHKRVMIGERYVDLDAYIMDETISLHEKWRNLRPLYSKPIISPKDALFLDAKGRYNARGRYLWLFIHLVASEQTAPVLRSARVFFPGMSLLSFLPGIYQEEERSRDFLERFLSLFGTFLDGMEGQIDQISRLFDVDVTTGGHLRWLGTWLGISVDDTWSDTQVRELLKEAPTLYRKRGTKQALERILQIYTGKRPWILEHFQLRSLREHPAYRRLADELFGEAPYTFCVILPSSAIPSDKIRLTVEQIIGEQKPAFTEAKLVIMEPWMYLDSHSYLGVNSYVSEPTALTIDERTAMPNHTVLIDVGLDHRLGLHTRLEFDSKLE
ncbi:phage tail protein [Brevibacillus dissolubilis]|uniref:phage tail protein n=1 Tax=Brevibacillus dissolubilis TaxID=1844116 RepID=UPI0011160C7A|nr:phage tail protein [Brevibacillus dissolubilis]